MRLTHKRKAHNNLTNSNFGVHSQQNCMHEHGMGDIYKNTVEIPNECCQERDKNFRKKSDAVRRFGTISIVVYQERHVKRVMQLTLTTTNLYPFMNTRSHKQC